MSKLVFNIDEDTRLKVYEMFERTKEQVDEDIKSVIEWLKTQPHLPELMDKAKIWNFLVLNKYNMDKVKQKIDMYYTVRSLKSDWFDHSNPKLPNLKQATQDSLWALHPKSIDGLYRIHFFKLVNPGKLKLREVCLQLFNIFEIRLQEDCMVGDIVVGDYENFTLKDFAQVTPALLYNVFGIYQKVYSLRLKAVYLVNSPPAISTMMKVLKSVLKPKIFDRFHVYKDDAILKEVFTEDVLPKDYGGKGSSLLDLQKSTNLKIDEFQNRFDELDELRVDESLRPENEDGGFYDRVKNMTCQLS